MKIDRVTMTGADDSIDPADLIAISREFPFVEWGILYSKSQEGSPRFPSRRWIDSYNDLARGHRLTSCAHLCGSMVRDFVLKGIFTWSMEYDTLVYQRIQLNFHAESMKKIHARFYEQVKDWHNKQFILQMDGVNDEVMAKARKKGADVVPLFDLSGGAGIVPTDWPIQYDNLYCGYAGGLGPTNIEFELERIAGVVKDDTPIWIDMETKVRSNNDELFDLEKVVDVLKKVKPFVVV